MKGAFKWIRTYGDETSVHGIKYITWGQPKYPCYLRLIWACVVAAGFFCAGYLIRQAFIDWEEQQVITTLDSVAAPFTDIQFPTVTVCNDEQTMPDSWALITHLINFWKWECYPDNPDNRMYPDCNDTMKLRQDFAPFINWVIYKLKLMLQVFGSDNSTILFGGFDALQMVNDAFNQPLPSTTTENDTAEQVEKRSLNEFLNAVHMESLGIYYGEGLINHIKDELQGYSTKPSNDSDASNNVTTTTTRPRTVFNSLEECKNDPNPNPYANCGNYLKNIKIFIAATGIIVPFDSVLPFGNLLRTFARYKDVLLSPLPYEFEGDEFNGVDDFAGYVDYEYEAEYQGTFNCSELKPGFLEWHQLFTKLAQGIGIPNASLLDLPQLIGSQGIKELSKREPTFFKFPYTFCQESNKITGGLTGVEVCMQLWKDFMEEPWNYPHPCDENMDCCHKFASPEIIGKNLTAIMRAVKYAYHSANSALKVEPLRNLINLDTSPYPITEENIGFYSEDSTDNLNTMMPHCKLGNRVTVSGVLFTPKCEEFKPVITNRGICYSYNAEALAKFAVESNFTQSFENAFEDELGDSDQEIRNNLGSGKSFGLEFWLDNQAVPYKQTGTQSSFVVGITDKRGYLEMQVSGQQINLGTKTVMEVSAEATESSENLRVVDIAKRKCRFEDELSKKDGLFKIYNQATCQFECMLEYSAKTCRCVPWNLPPVQGTTAICDALSNYCFDVHMRNVSQLANCDCPMDCNRLSFSYRLTENTVDGDLEALCEGFGAGLNYTKTKMKVYPRPYQYHDTFVLNVTYNRQFLADTKVLYPKLCKEMMTKSIADVKVLWTNPYYIKYRQDKRVTFVDQISALGGTLGLFTGMSFLSMVELVYWIYSGFIKALSPSTNKSKKANLTI